MSGRRSHQRFAVAVPWGGSVRVLREVVVQRTGERELLAVSHAPAVTGTDMTLDFFGDGHSLGVKVRVIESRPVIIEGAVRHRIRLALLSADDAIAPALAARDSGAGQTAEAGS